MQASGEADSVVGPYVNEYVIILHASADGTRLKMVEEFFDSLTSTDWMGKLRAFREEKEKAQQSACSGFLC